MPANTENKSTRETALINLAKITAMERGTLTEEYREQPSADGNGSVRRGPYFKHQCWEDGRNRSVRVPVAQAPQLREDINNGLRFDQLTAQLAQMAIEQGRAQRSALSAAPASVAGGDSKKNSARSVSKKGIARRKPSSRRSAKHSRRKA